MDFNKFELNSEHKQCIISLINKIIAKSPHLIELKSDSVLFTRLVSVINLIESTLCSKYQIALKRNSTESQSIHLIKSWLKQYYNQYFITSLCANESQTIRQLDSNKVVTADDNIENNNKPIEPSSDETDESLVEYINEDIDRDVGLIALLVLFIAHKLRQSLPRINAYFSPEWQTLSQFDSTLNKILNFDKLLDLIQNELCIKRKQLEITKSKMLSLKSTLNSRTLEQMKQRKTKLDYRSNLFAEYEDNDDTDEAKDLVDSDAHEEYLSENSEGSEIFIDHLSDDDYEPKNKTQKLLHKKSPKKSGKMVQKSGRGRGRPSKGFLNRMSSQRRFGRSRIRGPSQKAESPTGQEEDGLETPFECENCGKRFAKEYRLTRHSFTHLGHKQFICDYPNCNESFDLKWKLSEHKSEHTDGDEDESYTNTGNPFECEWADCGLVFTSKRELTAHEHEMHANRSQSKYSCDWPHCREIFENKIDWRKHVKTHGRITPTECGYPGCNKSFYKLDSLENHRKIHETFTLEELP